MWKKKANAAAADMDRSEVERKVIMEQYNYGIRALRKYKSNALTVSPLLNATTKLEGNQDCLGRCKLCL